MRITLRLALDDYFEEKISLASFAAFHFSGHLVRPGAFLVVTDALDPSKKRVAEIKKIARLTAGRFTGQLVICQAVFKCGTIRRSDLYNLPERVGASPLYQYQYLKWIAANDRIER